MTLSRQEIKDNLKSRSIKIKNKVTEYFGDHMKDIDFSQVELFTVLFFSEIRHKPENPGWTGRDKLVVSNLKSLPSLLAVLAESGFINWKEFHDLIVKLPRFFSNPNLSLINYPGVEFISDSPYQGMIQSLSYALVGKKSRSECRVYHVLSDKKSTALQEALITAADVKLNNLTAIMPFVEMQKRSAAIHFWFSMGWQVEEVRFDEPGNIYEGLARANRSKEKPQVLIG